MTTSVSKLIEQLTDYKQRKEARRDLIHMGQAVVTALLSKAGEELVKSRYTWDVVAKEYEKIYFRMLEDTN